MFFLSTRHFNDFSLENIHEVAAAAALSSKWCYMPTISCKRDSAACTGSGDKRKGKNKMVLRWDDESLPKGEEISSKIHQIFACVPVCHITEVHE